MCSSQQQRPNRIHFSNSFLAYYLFSDSFISCMNSALMKTLQTPPHPSLDDNPMQQRLPAPGWMLVPLNLFANTYNHSRLRLVMSHKSFITSSLALKIIKFPFLLCVPLLTDSRWGTLALDKQTMRNRGMSLLTDTGASLNCLWSGLAFVF